MFIAAIPTMHKEYVLPLIKRLTSLKVRFDKIIVLNDSATKENMDELEVYEDVFVVNNNGNKGVNASWNFAIEYAKVTNSHLALLNDDIEIQDEFVRKAMQVFNQIMDVGLLVPTTFTNYNSFQNSKINPNNERLIPLKKREGWCMFLNKDFLKTIPLIPGELKNFCGDDWIFDQVSKSPFSAMKDTQNRIFHEVGKTMKQNPEIRKTMLQEKRNFNKLVKG